MPAKKIKLFLSHASEDKNDFVQPLRDRLLQEGFDIWYAEDSLIVGQSLLRQISQGLKDSDYGVVALSQHFFAKKWPQEELDGLFALETEERKMILQIWHNVTEEELKEYSPIIAGRYAALSSTGLDAVVSHIKNSTTASERQKELDDPVSTQYASLNRKAVTKTRSDQLRSSIQGVELVLAAVSKMFDVFESRVSTIRGEKLPFPVQKSSGAQPGFFVMVQGPGYHESNAQRILTLRFDVKNPSK